MSTMHRLLRSPWTWLLVALIVGASLSVTHGLTNWWDLINYHIYDPWALLHHREGIDLFPAGIQGYFDPLLDIPYYLVAYVWLPDHPYVVAALTGLPFGLLVFVTLMLARQVLADLAGNKTVVYAIVVLATVTMAVSGNATWSQAFTTTNDIFVSALVLGALVLLIGTYTTAPKPPLRAGRALAIGALLGLAAGLKLTAVAYAPAAGLLLLVARRDWRSALRNGAVFFAGWLVAFAVFYGPWAMHLYESTGNPFFPMFNNLFDSTFSAATGGRDLRGMPGSVQEWLLYPFYWLDYGTNNVQRMPFRDARFALAYAIGLVSAATALFIPRRASEKQSARPRRLLALLAFWLIGYVTWLLLFSLLRYAVVLEVSGCIVAAGGLLYLAGRLAPRLSGLWRALLTCTLAAFCIGFASVPDLGFIPMQAPTFQANVPALGEKPLVILANQPMGLLAPLIERAHPGAVFLGIPSCFMPGQWCYEGFYDYDLGQRMRDKITAHRGPMYVAYYSNRVPSLPQLDLFHVRFDADRCKVMHTNRTADVMLCPARYAPAALPRPPSTLRFQLAAQTEMLDPRFTLSAHWLQNTCDDTTNPGQIAFDWRAPPGIDTVRVYIEAPPSSARTLFAGGGANGHAETGLWVTSAQTFVFTDATGHVLARSPIRYISCEAGH